MMINSICTTCFQPYKLLIQPSDVELVKQIATNEGRNCPCPRLCGGEINLTGQPNVDEKLQLRDPVELTGLQLFQAAGGLGLPDEIPKDAIIVAALFKSRSVTSLDLQEQNGNLYLNEIRLEDGVTLHLTAGACGARILKITKERGT